MAFLQAIPPPAGRLDPGGYPFGTRRAAFTFDEERREMLESVLEAMAGPQSDADRSVACRYLLRHLTKLTSVQAGLLVS
ncbi:MAG TPA: hypothetical protein VE959_08440 [Bryobacteraceae bacterium]|nr:hypothetical protein [Bryobacteraceae bacterium]